MLLQREENTLFNKTEPFIFFQQSYNNKHSELQSLIKKITPEEKSKPNYVPTQNEAYRYNPKTEQWEKITEKSKKSREECDYDLSLTLVQLFSQQHNLDEDTFDTETETNIKPKLNNILVSQNFRSRNTKLEIKSQEFLLALNKLVPCLELPYNITGKQAEVAIEIMDLVISALNPHSGKNDKNVSHKPLSKEDMIKKLNSLGKELESNGFTGKSPIILGILLCVASILTLSVLLGCVIAPTLGPAICTMLGMTASVETAFMFYFAGIIGIAVGFVTIVMGALVFPQATVSPDSNPKAAKAVLDVAKAWDLEPENVSAPAFSG